MMTAARNDGPDRIVSGGQTGVDRAALDVALELGIPCGGWCPLGRRSEDGAIPARYPLEETPTANYEERTEWNVRDSDGTLVIYVGAPASDSGTAYTIRLTRKFRKPHMLVDPTGASDLLFDAVRQWIAAEHICILNVAGPRESSNPGIHDAAAEFLKAVLEISRSRS